MACVFLCFDDRNRLLLHRRTRACRDEAGVWDCGGGEVEFGEDLSMAAQREVQEEYGAQTRHLRPLGVRNVIRDLGQETTHWVAVVFEVRVDPSEVRINEPEKMDDLGWFHIDDLPKPLHSQLEGHLTLYRNRNGFATKDKGIFRRLWKSIRPREEAGLRLPVT